MARTAHKGWLGRKGTRVNVVEPAIRGRTARRESQEKQACTDCRDSKAFRGYRESVVRMEHKVRPEKMAHRAKTEPQGR